jgi:next-to-BRCA1 protein 1
VSSSVADGAILPPNKCFEQTWVLRNSGQYAWPAGCSFRWSGGDDILHLDDGPRLAPRI